MSTCSVGPPTSLSAAFISFAKKVAIDFCKNNNKSKGHTRTRTHGLDFCQFFLSYSGGHRARLIRVKEHLSRYRAFSLRKIS